MRQSTLSIGWRGVLTLFILFSFFAIYLQQSIIANVLILGSMTTVMLYYIQTRDLRRIPKTEIGMIAGAFMLTLLTVILNQPFSFRSYFFMFSAAGIYFILRSAKPTVQSILSIYNLTFLVYVFLSALLYFNIISIDREINAFPATLFGFSFTTFYGFHGSTASIDSYSALTVIVNALLNKRLSKWFFIVLGGLIAIGTLRSTPVLVIVGSLLAVSAVRLFGKWTISVMNLLLFVSFTISYIALELIEHNTELMVTLKMATTGRSNLWVKMLDEYFDQGVLNQLFGFSNENSLSVDAWREDITNPHSSYFSLLISYGIIVFLGLYFWISSKMKKMDMSSLAITYAVLFGAVSNGGLFNFSGTPMITWVLFCAASTSTEKKEPSIPSHYHTKNVSE